MDPLLKELQKDAKQTPEQLAVLLGQDAEKIADQIRELEESAVIMGYHAVVDREKAGDQGVRAMIEVRLTPERGGGFDRLAMRISKFDQVTSCYLISGGYDLAVEVEGETLREVARFVAEKLSTLEGVISTATHFQLKVYKQNGFLAQAEAEKARLSVAP